MKFNGINLPCLFITLIVAINLFNLCEMRNKSSMRPPKVIPTALPGRVCAKSNILLAKCTPGHECKRIDLGFKSKSQISKCVQSRRATGFRRKEIKMKDYICTHKIFTIFSSFGQKVYGQKLLNI